MVLREPKVFKHANSYLGDHAKLLPMSCVRLKMEVAYFLGMMMEREQTVHPLSKWKGHGDRKEIPNKAPSSAGQPYML